MGRFANVAVIALVALPAGAASGCGGCDVDCAGARVEFTVGQGVDLVEVCAEAGECSTHDGDFSVFAPGGALQVRALAADGTELTAQSITPTFRDASDDCTCAPPAHIRVAADGVTQTD